MDLARDLLRPRSDVPLGRQPAVEASGCFRSASAVRPALNRLDKHDVERTISGEITTKADL